MAIYESIVSAMADIEPIAKGRRNQKQGFDFRGIDDIMNELQPVLKKHGLFVVPKVVNVIRAEKQTNNGGALLYSIATMEYTMYAKDGSFITGSTIGEGMDSGDKASNKAMSVALKYFLLQTFCIPTEDQKDPDFESPEVSGSTRSKEASLVLEYLDEKPPVYNAEWIEYAKSCIDSNNIDGHKKCIEQAVKVMKKREIQA